MNRPKLNLLLIVTFYYKCLNYKKNIYNLGNKTVLYFIYIFVLTVLSECKTEKRNSQCEHVQTMERRRDLFCTCDSDLARCQSMLLLAIEFDMTKEVLGRVRLAAVNQICAIHEPMNGRKKSKDSLMRMHEENGVFFKPVFKIKDKYMIYDDLDRSGYI